MSILLKALNLNKAILLIYDFAGKTISIEASFSNNNGLFYTLIEQPIALVSVCSTSFPDKRASIAFSTYFAFTAEASL